jgi:Cytochrome oxidase complex assembly protein 1
MIKAPYAVVPVAGEQEWRDRHPNAKIWIGCLVAIILPTLFGIGGGCLVEYSFHHHPTTQQALARAQDDPRIAQAIGQPMQVGWVIKGNIHVKDGHGYADLRIPISGPNGKGTIVFHAKEISRNWEFSILRVDLDGSTTIDLR